MTLTDFLLTRITEDEATACYVQVVGSCEPAYDPGRVLAECLAKRRIVEEHIDDGQLCTGLIDRDDSRACRTLRILAAVYANHERFRAEWRP